MKNVFFKSNLENFFLKSLDAYIKLSLISIFLRCMMTATTSAIHRCHHESPWKQQKNLNNEESRFLRSQATKTRFNKTYFCVWKHFGEKWEVLLDANSLSRVWVVTVDARTAADLYSSIKMIYHVFRPTPSKMINWKHFFGFLSPSPSEVRVVTAAVTVPPQQEKLFGKNDTLSAGNSVSLWFFLRFFQWSLNIPKNCILICGNQIKLLRSAF